MPSSAGRRAVHIGWPAAGAAVGASSHWLVGAIWSSAAGQVTASLVVVTASAFVIGFVLAGSGRSGPAELLLAGAGTAACLRLNTVFALSLAPLWCVLYLVLVPVGILAGVATGVAVAAGTGRSAAPGQLGST